MRKMQAFCLFSSLFLSSCGSYVPELEEGADPNAGQILVEDIVRNINCEVRDSVVQLYDAQPAEAAFLNNWAVQLDLTLTVDEKGTVAPSANLLPPSPAKAVFSLGLGATASSEAKRIDKLGETLAVADILKRGACGPAGRTHGAYLLESDLKLKQWLFDVAQIHYTNPKDKLPRDTFSQEISFDLATGISGTPGWKLINATVNPSGTFASANRERTHDLIITFGPIANAPPVAKGGQKGTASLPAKQVTLAEHAANTALSSQISSAITTGITNALTK